ncbi:MAG: class I SAM-dependent methyltransferase, partial [Actinobacteria bacterium]|nr:class I SAM-dependent methyltransferase [Actinomycetota bacterium]
GALAGTAEQIPLPDASVDALLVGQAFHWFDAARAVPEMERVVRPGGTIGLLWNVLDDAVPWVAQLCELFGAEDRASYALASVDRPYDAAMERALFPHVQPMDRELLADNLRSRSSVILLPEAERAELLERARALPPTDAFDLPYVCDTWRAVRT